MSFQRIKEWLVEHLPIPGMRETKKVIQEAGLLARIKRCEQFKKRITQRYNNLANDQKDELLDGKTYDEWIMLYDALIMEARTELEALMAKPTDSETTFLRNSVFLAALVTILFLILMIFIIASAEGGITGRVLDTSMKKHVGLGLLSLLFVTTIAYIFSERSNS